MGKRDDGVCESLEYLLSFFVRIVQEKIIFILGMIGQLAAYIMK